MNIHPLLVHFPIAFFIAYSVLEILPFKKLKREPYWFYIKALFVILGCFGALAAGITGSIAENQYAEDGSLIELHSRINLLASASFAVLALGYFIGLLKRANVNFANFNSLGRLASLYENIVLETPLIYFFVITGFILISIGGALGGAIVYGSNFDPFTHFVYSLFFH